MVDKSKAIINFLLECPQIESNPLFFNFINAKDDNKQIVTTGNEKLLNTNYVDGSVMKRYTFTIMDYKSIAYRAVVKDPTYIDENVEDLFNVQEIVDWVTTQAKSRNFPDFGSDCLIDSMRTLTDNPNLNGVDSNVTPALAKYSVSIQIDYIDTSDRIWG